MRLAAGMGVAIGVTATPAQAAGMYYGDLGQMIATVVVFLVLLAILAKWAWGPIVQQLKRREEAIAKTIERAEKTKAEAEELLEGYHQKLQTAQAEADDIRNQAQRDAVAEREKIVQAARSEAQQVAQAAEDDIRRARDEALRELQGTTAQMATEIASQILGQQLTEDQQQHLIDQSLDEIRRQAQQAPEES